MPTLQIAQIVPDQTEMIYQDLRKNALQSYINSIAHYHKRTNASKLKKADCAYVLYPKADYQGSKILVTEFRWMGPYIFEKVLPEKKYFVGKVGTKKTQMLHRMQLRQCTPSQHLPDVQITPREWKSDLEVIYKHDDL